MPHLQIIPLTESLLPAAVELDRLSLGGLWSIEGYRRELNSPNSVLVGLQQCDGMRELPDQAGSQSPDDLGSTELESELPQRESRVALESPDGGNDAPNPSDACLAGLLGLGCVWFIVDEAHLTLLAIHPDYRGQGLGQALLGALMQAARWHDMARATLEVRVSNAAAIALYQKFGFKTAGRRRNYYQNPREDALILWKGGLQEAEFAQTLVHWKQHVCDRLAQHHWQLEGGGQFF